MLQYDKGYVRQWREKAITKSEELQVGMRIWGKGIGIWGKGVAGGKGGVITEILSHRQLNKRLGLPPSHNMSDEALDAPGWVYLKDGYFFSLKDNGIGANYNPWLIFSSEELAKEYYAGLVVTFTPGGTNVGDCYDYDDYDDSDCVEDEDD